MLAFTIRSSPPLVVNDGSDTIALLAIDLLGWI